MHHRGLPVALALVLAGCADKATAPYPDTVPPPTEDAALGPGDVFDVRVFGEQDLSGTYQVATDGTIDYPLIGKVQVAGKLPTVVAADLEKRLADGYLKNPQVDVFVKGPGAGREMAIRSLQSSGVQVVSITDTTPIPFNGCRPPKRRRV